MLERAKTLGVCWMCVWMSVGTCLDNGVARTPPMGWRSWTVFLCETDCLSHPHSCINEELYTTMTDLMVSQGYKDAGYEYMIVDDCWPATQRDAIGRLVANKTRFPHGIRYLSRYAEKRGLKFGMYEDVGEYTCQHYLGSYGHFKTDAQSFAKWGTDWLQMDGCYLSLDKMDKAYLTMGSEMNKTGRPMVYACSWPHYYTRRGLRPNYTEIASACNVWRSWYDIWSNFTRILYTVDFTVSHQDELIPSVGPGAWNDPDMLVIGLPGLSVDQQKSQFGIWAIWSAPLLMSNDLRSIPPSSKAILTNRRVIALNQDPLGHMGHMVLRIGDVQIFTKKMTPLNEQKQAFSYGILFLNRNRQNQTDVSVRLSRLQLREPLGYFVLDLFENKLLGLMSPNQHFNFTLNPDAVILLKATLAA